MSSTNAITPIVLSNTGETVLTKEQQKKLSALTLKLRSNLQDTVKNLVEIGRDLIQAKELIGHGNFLGWLEKEFDLSDQSARRFMHVAEVFGDRVDALKQLSLRSVYALAAPSTSEEIRNVVLQRISKGETISFAEIQALRSQADGTAPPDVDAYPLKETSFRADLRKVSKKLSVWTEQIQKDWRGIDGTIGKKSKTELSTLHQELSSFVQTLGTMLEEAKEAPKQPRKKKETKVEKIEKTKTKRPSKN